jgi:hypothetical protein
MPCLLCSLHPAGLTTNFRGLEGTLESKGNEPFPLIAGYIPFFLRRNSLFL